MNYDNKRYSPSGRCQPTFSNIRSALARPVHIPDCALDESTPGPAPTKEIGLVFEWDNGEHVASNIPCHLHFGGETRIYGTLDNGKLFCPAPPGEYTAQLLENLDEQKKLSEARQTLKKALDDIIEFEKAEAAALAKVQEGRSDFSNTLHLNLAVGKGFFLGAWGLIVSLKNIADLANPLTQFSNALTSAWNAKSSEGQSWGASFLQNYSEEQKRELIEVLGFDPEAITRESLVQAYETACFIYGDQPSKQLLEAFAVTYVSVQNKEELAAFGGAVIFEIVLSALLIVFTGGVGLAARAATSAGLLKLLRPLGTALLNVANFIKRATIKSASRTKGITGSIVRTIRIRKPKAIIPGNVTPLIIRDWSHLRISQRHFPHKVTIPKKTGNTMYTVPAEIVAKDLKEIHSHGEAIRKGETFITSSGRAYGTHEASIHPISGPGVINITSTEYNVLITAKKKGMASARKFLEEITKRDIITKEQNIRTSKLLELMSSEGVK
ncbi:hypothetical protein [Pseudomonas alkylphenolica]|uniref:hypothetical protein n=1 Tax=Pseudomonas alkylphenolica TaxID=237609 RepID=UPI0018D9A47B|nr:hypothetical protein [Pseudomonas alkylphenolica]MBH3428106.1 hypothetical protein [Pseudomonas alkylphenolica]